ncbi:MAG TPA: NAD(P)H-dependent oxidoreductase subunit E [Bacteroidales bacterium]|nr:NAD(P)H-dependent oxidoreductase subunit E [Bacteroidales bacterium]HPS62226.1 NAD(P)H-dependent oxidoreductase subunit E [Bacteroidales bacterium]
MNHYPIINHPYHEASGGGVAFTGATLEKVRAIMARYPEGQQKSALLPVLHIAQEELGGYLSVDVMNYVASLLGIQPIEVYEVATFYSMFRLEPAGKYVIEVCRTGPCTLAGGERILGHLCETLAIGVGETTPDGLFTLKETECLGSCGTGPTMQVNTEFYEQLTPGKIDRILEDLREQALQTNSGESSWAGQFS